MNIGFDLDGIFIHTPPFIPRMVIELLYRGNSTKKLTYRFPHVLEQKLRRFIHAPVLRPAIQDNIEFIKELALKNTHKRIIISGRFGFLEDITHKLVKKHKFDKLFHKLEFNFANKQPHLFKQEFIKKHQIHIFIDDDLPLLKFLATHNPKITFFWFNNKQSHKITNNLFAIKHLSDIFK